MRIADTQYLASHLSAPVIARSEATKQSVTIIIKCKPNLKLAKLFLPSPILGEGPTDLSEINQLGLPDGRQGEVNRPRGPRHRDMTGRDATSCVLLAPARHCIACPCRCSRLSREQQGRKHPQGRKRTAVQTCVHTAATTNL